MKKLSLILAAAIAALSVAVPAAAAGDKLAFGIGSRDEAVPTAAPSASGGAPSWVQDIYATPSPTPLPTKDPKATPEPTVDPNATAEPSQTPEATAAPTQKPTEVRAGTPEAETVKAVSYTHLDVYKRQGEAGGQNTCYERGQNRDV